MGTQPGFAQSAQGQPSDDLAQLSIDELINLEVTSPSKKTERASDVAAAIYVITNEDIRRSGATTIAEALRLAPGLDVARVDNSQWAISSRGFNGVFGDKLLVLIDGRTVYTPLWGGVFWNEQDYLLDDIERIEVIRGPGATLYGVNAVNGVINIITKSAKDTRGGFVTAGGGDQERVFGAARYGVSAGRTHARAYAKAFNRHQNELASGGSAHDDWQGVRAGFRSDTDASERDLVTVQGDYFYQDIGWDHIIPDLAVPGFMDVGHSRSYMNGGNLLGRWSRELQDNASVSWQSYYEHTDRDDRVLSQRRDTFDTELDYRFSPFARHDVVSGIGYRIYRDDDMDGTFSVSVDPPGRTLDLYQGFLQDEITIVPDTWKLIVGTKLEENELSGFEVMPTIRAMYNPARNHSIWSAVSRAVRSPTRFNKDGRLVIGAMQGEQGLPAIVTLNGDSDYGSENLLAYELGYRVRPIEQLSLDAALFINDYDDLESAEPAGEPFLSGSQQQPYIEVPFRVENRLQGQTYGGELTATWQPRGDMRFTAWYSYLDIDLSRKAGSMDTIYMAGETQSPRHQTLLRSQFDLPLNTQFDAILRYVSDVKTFDIDAYWSLDARLAWKVRPNLELSVVGQNLLDSAHVEFESNLVNTQRTELKRGVYGQVRYYF